MSILKSRKVFALFLTICLVQTVFLLPEAKAQNLERKKVALIIGNANYTGAGKLRNTLNDANDMARTLRALGFEVILGTDLNRRQMFAKVRQFGDRLRITKGVGLFYYSGHGVQAKGQNYIIPTDAVIPREDELQFASMNFNFVLQKMASANNGLNIVILDACRNNPFAKSWNKGAADGGLAQVNAPTGTFIAYATAPDTTASDGTRYGRNGLYTKQLLKYIKQPGLKIEEAFKQVTIAVDRVSRGTQIPWTASSLRGEFYFSAKGQTEKPNTQSGNTGRIESPTQPETSAENNSAAGKLRNKGIALALNQKYDLAIAEFVKANKLDPASVAPNDALTELQEWKKVKLSNDHTQLVRFLMRFPQGEFISEARNRLTSVFTAQWLDLKKSKKVADYRSFIENNPFSGYKAQAQTTLTMLVKSMIAWEKLDEKKTEEQLQKYVSDYPEGVYRPNATSKLASIKALEKARLESLQDRERFRDKLKRIAQVETLTEGLTITNSIGMELVYIPSSFTSKLHSGSFIMGSPSNEKGRWSNEGPQRSVTIGKGFLIGKYEVTQEEYEKVMGTNPSYFKNCPKCPVEGISWNDAKEYIRKLNARNDAFEHRLPTEAEWEYSARAGTATAFAFGDSLDSSQANFDGKHPYPFGFGGAPKGEYKGKTVPVGSYKPNVWGLYDMHGNVFEWVEDIYSKTYQGAPIDGSANMSTGDSDNRVLRGGAWYDGGNYLRSAIRRETSPSGRGKDFGFRVVARPR